jgi:DNA replication protein DnaC
MIGSEFAQVPGSWTVLNVERRLHHCQLHNLNWSRCPYAVQPVLDFMGEVTSEEPSKLILFGKTGLGKSHIAVGLYRWGVYMWDTAECMYLHVPSFCDRVKSSYGEDDPGSTDLPAYADLKMARRLVIVDDVFGRELTRHELQVIVPNIITLSFSTGAAVVFTMNYTLDEASKYIPAHEFDRMLAGAREAIEFDGPSYRIAGNDEQEALPLGGA